MEFQGSRTWVEINLDNFRENLIKIRNYVGNDVKILAVIKADGYGHGAVELAKVCEQNEVDHFAVACLSEGKELRKAGITKPILILSYVDLSNINEIVEFNLTPTVFDYEFSKKLNERLIQLNKKINVHIKLDTGMTRLGFSAVDIDNTIKDILNINEFSNINIEGIYTHYADSDNEDLNYCDLQFERYISVINKLNESGLNIPLKHTCNSAGVITCKEKHLDMVRCGIMLYGYYPSCHLEKILPDLKPILSWKAKISQVKYAFCDTTVSYGRTRTVKEGTKLAVVSVGYADGYQRRLSNNFFVIINGKKAPIIGIVCMDQIIVDVSDIASCNIGDDVILIGGDEKNFISASDMANKLGTISYEILCNIGKRVPRVYIKNNKYYKINNR